MTKLKKQKKNRKLKAYLFKLRQERKRKKLEKKAAQRRKAQKAKKHKNSHDHLTKKHLTVEHKITIIKLILVGAITIQEAAKTINVSRMTIYRWIKKYKSGKSLEDNRKNKRGTRPKISLKIGKKILLIIDQPASKFGFETDLWTLQRISIILMKKFKLKVSKSAIHRFLHENDYTSKKAQKKYFEVNEEEQALWKKKIKRILKALKKKHRSLKILFLDESTIQLSPEVGKGWAKKGRRLVVKVTGNRGSIAMISCISPEGDLLFETHTDAKRYNNKDIIEYLKKCLSEYKRKHLVVIMDKASCHTAKAVKSFVESQKRLTVIYIPARSPELNPDEQVWNHLKHAEIKNHKMQNIPDLERLIINKMNKLKNNPSRVRGVFRRCENSNLYK